MVAILCQFSLFVQSESAASLDDVTSDRSHRLSRGAGNRFQFETPLTPTPNPVRPRCKASCDHPHRLTPEETKALIGQSAGFHPPNALNTELPRSGRYPGIRGANPA
jgi:hypothetical protein